MSVVESFPSTSQCRYCAEALKPAQQKCTKCGAFQDKTCISCGASLPPEAVRCSACKKVQEGTACRACGALLERGSRRCTDCSSWQTARRFIPESQVTLALLLSIISVCGALIPPVFHYFDDHSKTFVRIIGDSEYEAPKAAPEVTIRVLVVNNGTRPSIVKSGRIAFENLNAAPTDLRVCNRENSVVLPQKQEVIYLSAETVPRTNGATKPQILASLAGGTARIVLHVEETNRHGEFYDAKPAPEHAINTSLIQQWMEKHVSSSKNQ